MNHIILNPGDPLSRNMFPDNALFFFDFDGVLATQCEEKVYRLEEDEEERERLERLAPAYGIRPELYGTRYLRHLTFQANVNEAIEPYHIADFARSLVDPYFVVTARSGLFAVQRLIDFLRNEELTPQEVFCLGRASKGLLLAELRKDWATRPSVFFDDTQHHIDAALALRDPMLTVVEVRHDPCTANAERLIELYGA